MPSVVVVGASRGIGREFVRHYAEAGWQVFATVRQAAGDLGDGVTELIADVTDEASLQSAAAAVPDAIDLLILNAGVGAREMNLASIDAAAWPHIMATNALGPLLAARALGPKVRDGGTIVALSSTLGSIAANTGGGLYSYRMSKAALNAGMKTLAIELRRRRIAVAVLHPGWVKTDMGGAGAEVEVADSVAGLTRVIAGLTAEASGALLDYRGNALPW
ncbi:MAG: SDR family oxidoreductase [Sphingomonadaceae bacterium]|nr:SDR family oxidoreductase [Sphingomonadaceae bacterium]